MRSREWSGTRWRVRGSRAKRGAFAVRARIARRKGSTGRRSDAQRCRWRSSSMSFRRCRLLGGFSSCVRSCYPWRLAGACPVVQMIRKGFSVVARLLERSPVLPDDLRLLVREDVTAPLTLGDPARRFRGLDDFDTKDEGCIHGDLRFLRFRVSGDADGSLECMPPLSLRGAANSRRRRVPIDPADVNASAGAAELCTTA